ncbi:MAG: hypothetical protein IPK58_16555 [Acidobacteria bacterium]|nr:hypothetical protein [Acidobacteriota bacterium]
MCGIVGFVNNNGRAADRSAVERMNAAIVHRGPDDDGFYVNENVALAMRRLAIIDLAGGHQPMFNTDRSKVIVFNGEIYNFQELRADLEKLGDKFYTNSDTETIVHLYDRYGADCISYLRGMFAFAIWDETDRSLFIARDRVGKNLCFTRTGRTAILFSDRNFARFWNTRTSRATSITRRSTAI